ncbi:MAG: signal peptidase II [Peptostreptococcaceae bacterium]|nr:signal peptidase II [Peptostreptococcaceae bacterium]
MYYIIMVIGILCIDRFTKYLAIEHLQKVDTFPLIDGALHFTYAENTGAAFSILTGKQGLLILFTGMVIMVMCFYFWREKEHMSALANIAMAMIIGGAMGNFIDRILWNYVVDFIDFRLIDFAIFNVADSFIVVGALLLGYTILFDKASA